MNNKISIFGSSGFVGNYYLKLFNESCIPIDREDNKPKSKDVLYFISTVDNYNIFDNPYIDIDTNLTKLIKQSLEEIITSFTSFCEFLN
jgi:hypothetical protein